MKKLVLFFLAFLEVLVFSFSSRSQCPTASFINPDTVCSNNPTSLVNTSSGSGALNFQWNFCGGAFSQLYTYALDDSSSPNSPSSMSLVYDSTNWFGFLFNYGSMTITRYDFGISLDNAPTTHDLGNLNGAITGSVFWNDMSFVKEGNNWYGIFCVYSTANTIRVDFGANLDNDTPSTFIYTNPQNYSPNAYQDLKIDSGNLYLLAANDNGSILRLNYGNSITNTPVADLISLGLGEIGDISLVKYCDHWYGFLVSYDHPNLYRLDFGNSLRNAPTLTDLGNPDSLLYRPYNIQIIYDGDQWYALETNYYGKLNRIDFGKDLTNTSPTAINLTYTGIHGIGNYATVTKMNSAFYLFTCSINDNKFSKVKYESPCSAVPQTSTQKNPVVEYDSGGTYIISLSATDSSGNVNYFSDSINVTSAPTANFSFQNTCFNDTTLFNDSSFFNQGTITGRLWNFGDSTTASTLNPTHKYASPGKYVVSLTLSGSTGCNVVHTDTVIIGAIPVANFAAIGGCSNVSVLFTDSSTIGFGNTTVSWKWNFGNNDTSTLQNPVYEYPVGGSYDVTLTVTSNNNCSSSYDSSLTILDAPKAGFRITNTCVVGSAFFTDTSSGTINSWSWNFGDAGTSSFQNPSHAYPPSVATYTVSLVATSTNGCRDTSTVPIKINNVPVPGFSFAPSTICEGNAINLTDTSTVLGDTIYAWHWDFGDTDTSFIKNPSHSYVIPGSYDIVLTVYSQTSCSAFTSKHLTVVPSPTAAFIFTASCLGDSTRFTDMSTPALGTIIKAWHWDFGDGDTSNLVNPAHYYDSAAIYSVSLIITDSIGCTNIFATSDTVHGIPVAAFATALGCTSTPLQFIDTSTSADGAISAYSWNFGDPASGSNDSSVVSAPSHTYYVNGTYPVSLIVTTTFGCSNTANLIVTVNPASVANFTYKPTCEQGQMPFTNLDSLPALDSLWSWSFGDTEVSFIQSPSHYYFLPGIYSVTLTVTSNSSCVNSITKSVEVKPNPVANFVVAPGCINTPYTFQDISHVASGTITKWNWTFGNGDSSNVQFPQTIYKDTGDYIVTLTVISDTISGCTNSVTQTIHVYPLPTANFNYNPLFGSPPLNVNFNDLSSGAAAYLWEFGDGGTSADSTPSHTYQDTGKFNITQIVYSTQGCIDSLSKVIYVIKPRLDIAVTNISYQLQNNLFKVSAQVVNLGTRDINSYDMQASIQGGTTIDEHVNTTLPSGPQGIIIYNFAAAFQLSPEQSVSYYCISALNPDGQTDDNPGNNEKCATLTNQFTVVQPYPNPFSDLLQLQFILPYKGHVTVELFDNIGQEVSVLYDSDANAGGTSFQASTAVLENEIYFCRFTFQDQVLIYAVMKAAEKK